MISIERNKDLTCSNTFRMKVKCSCFVEYDTLEDLFRMDFSTFPQPFVHIGAGSNLLFTGDFPGTVFHSLIKFLRPAGDNDGEVLVEAGAGVPFDDFVEWACSMRLWGAENLSDIPGEVGAAAVQNIGAYGVEAKDIIVRVNCFDAQEREMLVFENAECSYGYRTSFFKTDAPKGRYFITSVLFRLSAEPAPKLDYGNIRSALGGRTVDSPSDVRSVITGIRKEKLPDPKVIGSAGSFFKNPVVSEEDFLRIQESEGVEVPHFDVEGGVKIPAAWMLDRCSLKGCSVGGASVYERQPLVIVNSSGNASPADILALENEAVRRVKERFGVILQPEVEHI